MSEVNPVQMEINKIKMHNLKVAAVKQKDKIKTEIFQSENIKRTLAQVDKKYQQEMTKISFAYPFKTSKTCLRMTQNLSKAQVVPLKDQNRNECSGKALNLFTIPVRVTPEALKVTIS